MDRSVDIFANMILSLNGEDIFIKAEKGDIWVTSPSVRSGLRALLNLDGHHGLLKNTTELNTAFINLGYTLYAHLGIFKLALLGLKGRRGTLRALFFFGRIGRMLGAV